MSLVTQIMSLEPQLVEVAVSFGARLIEFHFTDNKRRSFIDHQISFEPKDFIIKKKI